MKVKRLQKIKGVLTFFICFLLVTGGLSFAADQDNGTIDAASVNITAKIMEIDLDQDSMVIAEKNIQLLSTMQGTNKIWRTVFMDAEGRTISAQDFKVRDKVRLEGLQAGSGTITALSITLLSSKKRAKPDNSESSVRLENGTWVN